MLRIHAIGDFRVEVGDEDRTPAAFDRAAALLAPVPPTGLLPMAARLAAGCARRERSSKPAERALGVAQATRRGGQRALVATRDRVGLGDDVWVDVGEAERLRPPELEGARARRGLLPGLEDEWAFEARDEHRARTAAVLEQLAAASEEAGDLRRAADLSRALQRSTLSRRRPIVL
jgi:hypothetical protein